MNLERQLPTSGRIRKVQPLTKRLFFHTYGITSIDQLDDEFSSWLAEAYAVGNGEHLLR